MAIDSTKDEQMKIPETEGSTINPLRLAYDFVADFSIDRPSALKALRSHLKVMSADEVRQWFDHMGELMADEDITGVARFALLSALENMG